LNTLFARNCDDVFNLFLGEKSERMRCYAENEDARPL